MNEIITKLLASTAAIALAAFGPAAFAQSPQGATVASGAITVTRQGSTTVVTQGTDKGIIDWRSFSIGAQEAVRFDQPGRSSVTLNRVTGTDLSRIDGNLSATGQVWLSNPNGVLIGPTGQVNVGGLLATTGRIDATEFLRSGRAAIDQIGKDAAIVNSGTINITEGGYAALAAASIRNEGVIAARAGSVALGAGKAVTVDFTGDKLITFQVTEALDQAVPGDSMISVGGKIAAEGGTVLMSARAAKGVMDNVINLKGLVVANSVKVDGGTVSFGDGGSVQVSGRIDASNAAGKGGEVAVLGEKVGLLDAATIDASGATGGGTVLVGGDWQGKGPSHNAAIAYVAPTASINVDATMAGDGGKAVVWADDATRFNGTISARGGVLAGDGGQVETSGKNTLGVAATARVTMAARAAGAKGGSWLLDPTDVTIYGSGDTINPGSNTITNPTVDVSTIYTALNSGDVTIKTGGSPGTGNITVGAAIDYALTGAHILTLEATNDIIVSYSFTSSVAPTTLKLLAGRDIKINAPIKTNGGAFTALSNGGGSAGGIQVAANITTSGGAIVLAGGTDPLGGTEAVGGSGGLTHGVEITSSAVVDASFTSGGGGITINGKGFDGNTGSEIAGVVKTSGSGAISITGVTPYDLSYTAYGVHILSGASVETSGVGAITVTGTSQSPYFFSHGIFVEGAIKNTGLSTGLITLTGTRGLGIGSNNIAISGGSVTSALGDIKLDGSSGVGTGSASAFGVRVNGATVSTTGGSITILGTADQGNGGGSSASGVVIDGSDPLISVSAGTGSITITGKRGVGSVSRNIYIVGTSATNMATLSTAGGLITLDGSALTSGSTTSLTSMDGVYTKNALIQSGAGISITGNADQVAKLAANGVSIFDSSTLSLTGGNLSIQGNAFNVAGNDIYFLNSTISGGSGTATLTGNAIDSNNLSGSSGKTVFLPRTLGTIHLYGSSTSLGALNLSSGLINSISGPVEIGSAAKNTLIQVESGYAFSNTSTTFVTGDKAINFLGAIDGPGDVTAITDNNGIVSFAGVAGGSNALGSFTRLDSTNGNQAKTVFGASATAMTTGAPQSFSGPVELTASSVTFSSANAGVVFNGPVDSADSLNHSSLIVSASNGGVIFNNNFGANPGYALKSFTSYGTATLNGLQYKTDGAQSYSGAVVLGNGGTNAGGSTISAGGLVTFGGAIDAIAGYPKSLAVTADSIAFNTTATLGEIGSGGQLASLSLSVTNTTSTIDLPKLTADNLTLSAVNGAISQTTGITVYKLAKITTNNGGVTLNDTSNDFNKLTVTTGATGGALIADVNDIVIAGASVTGGVLSIIGGPSNMISQSGAITTPFLFFSNVDVVNLNDSGNQISKLSGSFNSLASNQALTFVNNSTGGLTLSSVGGKSLDITQTGAGGVSVGSVSGGTLKITESGGGNLKLTGVISMTNSATLSVSSGGLSFASGSSFTAASASLSGDTINGSGTNISVTNAPLVLSGNSGSVTGAIKVNGSTTPVAAGYVTLSTPGGSINLNAETINGPPQAATTATVATVASVPTVATVASVPTVAPTVVTVATVASAPTVFSVPTTVSVASIPTTSFVQRLIDLITNADPGGVTTILNQVLPPPPNFNLIVTVPIPPAENDPRLAGGNISAQALVNLVTATPPGAFIPPGAPFVVGTGAPLAVTPTIKIDPADTGGPNGQVIAVGPPGFGPVGAGPVGAGPGGGSGDRTLVPGLLSERRGPASGQTSREPPAGQLPATMNEEPMLD